MSAIIHKFEIPLTPEQLAAIREEWRKHGARNRAMLAIQPLFQNDTFDDREPHLRCAVLDVDLASEVYAIIQHHKGDRP